MLMLRGHGITLMCLTAHSHNLLESPPLLTHVIGSDQPAASEHWVQDVPPYPTCALPYLRLCLPHYTGCSDVPAGVSTTLYIPASAICANICWESTPNLHPRVHERLAAEQLVKLLLQCTVLCAHFLQLSCKGAHQLQRVHLCVCVCVLCVRVWGG